MEEKLGDKIFIERDEKIRLIIEHKIGFVKFLDQIKKRFKVNILYNRFNNERILLIEEKDESEDL